MIARNRSAACGAWRHLDDSHAHDSCPGTVNLPAPRDLCSCWCHGGGVDEPLDNLTPAERDLLDEVAGIVVGGLLRAGS